MINTVLINDNISLHYIPMTKLKTTAVSIYLHRQLNRDEASKNALLPHLLKNGSADFCNREEISKYLDNLYGARMACGISKKGDIHIINFEGESISDKYAPNGEQLTRDLINLLLSLIFNAPKKFSEEVFETERKNSITKIENIINDKRIYANYRCQEEMAKGDIFSIPRLGYVEDLKKLTADDMHDYYEKIITSTKIDIFVCGDTDIKAVEKTIKSYTEKFSFTKAEIACSHILKPVRDVQNITESLNVTQGKLSVGFLTDTSSKDEDIYAMSLANAIFGGGAQSKLFNNVRVKLSLAYYAGSVLNGSKGFLVVNAGIEFANFQKAYDEILVQLDEMKKGNITELEFEASKNFMINSLNSTYDDQFSLISYYFGGILLDDNIEIEDYKKRITKLTMDDVVKAINKVHLDTVYFLCGGEEN